jgi:hypothetical protein
METIHFNINLGSIFFNNAPKVSISLNHQQVFDQSIVEDTDIAFTTDLEDDSQHELHIMLYGKTEDDTNIATNGEIFEDTLVFINDIKFEDISIFKVLESKECKEWYYEHDCNGLEEFEKYPVRDTMGCNGSVVIKFTTPMYLWLLENM